MKNQQKSQIAAEYNDFWELAIKLADNDISPYPLQKREVGRDRTQWHLIGMLEMYQVRYGGINNTRTRLQAFQDIAKWLAEQHECEEILVPHLEEYLDTNIKDLQTDLENQDKEVKE